EFGGSVQKFVACPRGRGRPKDRQVLGRPLTVRLPVARGTTTGSAETVVPFALWKVRVRPVAIEAPARNVTALDRIMVLRMTGGPSLTWEQQLPTTRNSRPAGFPAV